ncbi:MAG: substrate-binding domain-containing protein [Armatimonadota bacterium]
MRAHPVAVLLACGLLLIGCRKPEDPNTLLVLCGNSFRPPMEALEKAFEEQSEVEIDLSIGQSEDLLPKVKIAAEGDVFVSHDPYLDYTEEADALLEGVQVGHVAPVLVVPKGNPAGVKSIEDLAKPGVKVALPDARYSTCGEMLDKLLEKKGIKEAVLENAGGAIFRSHSDTGTSLQVGEREAGVMWTGTAHTFRDSIEVVPTPYEYDETIRVWVMGLSYTENEALVRQFLEFVKTEGPPIFAEYGYTK